jgi:ABC-type branched-subunit amino acid transport system ATPase component/ABC-type branched-subunit amino acid transport system permease subunit
MSSGSWVLGILNGLTIGLLAVGLVLVYKSNRFLNLAHAQIGTVPALLLGKWVLDSGWNWWLAFAVAIVLGIVTALLVERLLVRPLMRKTRSPVRLLLLSLAVSQLLLALTYIPKLSPNASHQGGYPQPFDASVSVGGVVLTGMSVLTAILVPVLVIALALFMRYSLLGKQVRAAANNPDAARLCGIPIRRVSAITWGIAGACAAVSAVLTAPDQPSFNYASFGPYLLMLTLGAAALGAFQSLPLALAGGLLLGLVNQLVTAETSNGADAEVVVFLVILAIVLVRGKAIAKVFDLSGAVAAERAMVRIPQALRATPLVRFHKLGLALVAAIALVVWPQVPYFNTTGHEFLLSLVLIYALLGIALTMLVGWGGQVSLGHFAIVGLGAYLTARWQPHGLSMPALCILVGLVGALVLALIGLPALRVRGLTLPVTTLGFAVIATDWLFRQPWVGSEQSSGLVVTSPKVAEGLGTPSSQLDVYYAALVILALAFVAATLLRRSGPGRLIMAVRDNERASAAFGVMPANVKITLLAVSGFLAGAAGVLWADAWKSVAPSQFGADVSIAIIAIPVIGGLGSLSGAVAAAVLIYGGTFFIGPHFSSVFGDLGNNLGFSLFLAGAVQVAVLVRFPGGIAGVVQSRWQAYLDRRAPQHIDLTEEELYDELADRAEHEAYAGPHPAEDLTGVPLQVSNVRVRYGGIVALNGPDIDVRPGEIVGLIGTNGAGKTTLMNVISGLVRPSQGSVRLFDREVVDLPADIRAAGFGVARSFQDATLFGSLTVTETVQVPLTAAHKVGVVPAMLGAPWVRDTEQRTRREAQDIVRRFGLSEWADVRTSELSTGTRRICDLAAQVAAAPQLLLLDEPTAGVAQREAEAFGPMLRRLRDELNCSILIVEHDMPLLMSVCDRVFALEAGSVIAEGTPEEIRTNPRVIASYLGSDDSSILRSGAKSTHPSSKRRKP